MLTVYEFGRIAHKYGKPIVTLSWLLQKRVDEILKIVTIPNHEVIEDCFLVMSTLVRYGDIKRRFKTE